MTKSVGENIMLPSFKRLIGLGAGEETYTFFASMGSIRASEYDSIFRQIMPAAQVEPVRTLLLVIYRNMIWASYLQAELRFDMILPGFAAQIILQLNFIVLYLKHVNRIRRCSLRTAEDRFSVLVGGISRC